MSDRPRNLERIEKGGSHNLDVTWLNRPSSLGGVPTDPDGYSSLDPGATVTGTVMYFDATASDLDDPSNWSATVPADNPPVAGTLLDGGTTGKILAPITVPADATTTTALLAASNVYHGILWSTTIGGVTIYAGELFSVLEAGGASFGDGLLCTAAEFRSKSAFTEIRDLTDVDVELFLHKAQREFLQDVARRRRLVVLQEAPYDVADTEFLVPTGPEAGWLFPASFGDLEDARSYEAFYLDQDDVLTNVGIAAYDANRNRVTLANPKATTDSAHLTGWFSHVENPDPDIACDAIVALATHYVDRRAQQAGTIALLNPTGGRNLTPIPTMRSHLKEYNRLKAKYLRNDRGQVGAGRVDSRIGRRRGILG